MRYFLLKIINNILPIHYSYIGYMGRGGFWYLLTRSLKLYRNGTYLKVVSGVEAYTMGLKTPLAELIDQGYKFKYAGHILYQPLIYYYRGVYNGKE